MNTGTPPEPPRWGVNRTFILISLEHLLPSKPHPQPQWYPVTTAATRVHDATPQRDSIRIILV